MSALVISTWYAVKQLSATWKRETEVSNFSDFKGVLVAYCYEINHSKCSDLTHRYVKLPFMVLEVDWAQLSTFYSGCCVVPSEKVAGLRIISHVSGAWVEKTHTAGALGALTPLSIFVWFPTMAASGRLDLLHGGPELPSEIPECCAEAVLLFVHLPWKSASSLLLHSVGWGNHKGLPRFKGRGYRLHLLMVGV